MKLALKTLFLVLVVFGTSCKKEEKEIQKKLILLTSPAGWIMEKTELAIGDTWEDITSYTPPIDADNILTLYPTYEWKKEEGATKLPENAQLIGFGYWSLIDKQSKIQFEDGDLLEITNLTKDQLQVTVAENIFIKRYTYMHP
ncbi:hypothetical protein D9M68_816520 [compost metagenome]